MNTPTRIVSVALAAAALAAPALPASASSTDVVRRGSCSLNADWKLKASPENGRIQVEGEVDSNKSGQTWSWKIKDNGDVAASGSSKTGGRSGSFSVERKISNRAGTDKITFRASHSGEVCTGSIAF